MTKPLRFGCYLMTSEVQSSTRPPISLFYLDTYGCLFVWNLIKIHHKSRVTPFYGCFLFEKWKLSPRTSLSKSQRHHTTNRDGSRKHVWRDKSNKLGIITVHLYYGLRLQYFFFIYKKQVYI